MKYLTIAALLTLSACATSGVKVDQSKLTSLHKGETTYSEAIQLLGKPSSVSVSDDGSRMVSYIYTSSQARPETFIPIVGAFVGGMDTETSSANLTFDKNGILRGYNSNQGAMGVGTGLEAYTAPRTSVKGD